MTTEQLILQNQNNVGKVFFFPNTSDGQTTFTLVESIDPDTGMMNAVTLTHVRNHRASLRTEVLDSIGAMERTDLATFNTLVLNALSEFLRLMSPDNPDAANGQIDD